MLWGGQNGRPRTHVHLTSFTRSHGNDRKDSCGHKGSPSGVRKQGSKLTAYQKVYINPERQKADGMRLVENWGRLKGLHRQI